MKAYIIKQESTKTHFITSDIIDVLNMIENVSDHTPILITTKVLTVEEFRSELKLIQALNMSLTPPPR